MRAEKGLLLERQQLYALAEFRTQSEILGVLADGPYGQELSELKDSSSQTEMERAVRLSFARSVRTLLTSSHGSVKHFLKEFSRRFDAFDLASLIVFKAQGNAWEDFVATRLPLALLKEAELHHLYALDDIHAIVSSAGDRTLTARLRDFSLEDISGERAALVRDIILGWGEERFHKYVDSELSGFDRRSCLPIVGAAIDLANLAVILRSKIIGNLNIRNHIIPESWKLDSKTKDQLVASQDVGQALEIISSHSYYGRVLQSARQKYDESGSLSFMEVASRKHSMTLSR
ncbi:MAG TPA: V-type ATPase subunit, partial [Candidatus Bathyarchaeia archaeon]|nr:V-type ATPase subunit [Candidatus Bathyarchaeia archaeon]